MKDWEDLLFWVAVAFVVVTVVLAVVEKVG